MYQRDNATEDPSCAAEQFSSGLVGGCEAGHVMDTDTFASTVVSEWDLVCGGAGNNQVGIFRLQNIIFICIFDVTRASCWWTSATRRTARACCSASSCPASSRTGSGASG